MKEANALQKLLKTVKRHPYILLAVLILITCMIIYYQYIFNGYTFMFEDIGSDTKDQYVMQFSTIVNHIRNGNFSLWDFSNGFGTSMYQLTLFNPALWILYLIGIVFGPQAIPGALIYVHILVMLLSGLAAYRFLSSFSFSRKAIFIAAYIYAFNGFVLVWGQHYHFSCIMVLLPLLLSSIERSLQKGKPSAKTVIITGITMLTSYYLCYMSLIVAALYIILRIFQTQRKGLAHYFKTLILQGLTLLLGVFFGVINLIPSIYNVFNVSARMNSGMSLIERCIASLSFWTDESYYQTLMKRLFSSNLEGIGNSTGPYTGYSNYYEAPTLFFSALFIILFVQFIFYWFRVKESKRTKIVELIAVLFGIFTVTIPLGSQIFNAFSYPFARETFLFMPFFGLVVAYMFDKVWTERYFSIIGALMSIFLSLVVYGFAIARTESRIYKVDFAILLLTCIVAAVLLLCIKKTVVNRQRYVFTTLLFGVLLINVAFEGYGTVATRTYVQKGSSYFEALYGNDMKSALAYLEEIDDNFYRMEKTYESGSTCMDALAIGYRGMGTYNSTMNGNIQKFNAIVVPQINYVNQAHINFRQIAGNEGYARLFGIKYLLSYDATPPALGYTLLNQFGNIYIYENQNWAGFAQFYTQTVSEDIFEFLAESTEFDREAFLKDYLVVDEADCITYEYPGTDKYSIASYSELSIDEAKLSSSVDISEEGSYTFTTPGETITFNQSVPEKKKIAISFLITSNANYNYLITPNNSGTCSYDANVTAGEQTRVTLVLPVGVDSLSIVSNTDCLTTTISNVQFLELPYEEKQESQSSAMIEMKDTNNDSHLSATISTDESGLLFFPISYEDGWSAKIDGEETALIQSDYGFLSVKISEPGNHTVTLTYQQPMLKEAILITIISIVIFLFFFFLLPKRRKKAD